MLLKHAQEGPSAYALDSHVGPIIQMFTDMKEKCEGNVAGTEKHDS